MLKSIRFGLALGASTFTLGLANAAHAQVMGSSDVEQLFNSMMEQPASVFLGLPIAYERIRATDLDGLMTNFSIEFEGADLAGEPLEDLTLTASRQDDNRLAVSLDLTGFLAKFAEEVGADAYADILRFDGIIDVEAQAYEYLAFTADDISVKESSDPENNAFNLEGAIFVMDERAGNKLATYDMGYDGLSFKERGVEQINVETVGFSFERLNVDGWLLHDKVNSSIASFASADAGLIAPTVAIANVLDDLAPLFDVDLQDLAASVDVGKIVAQGMRIEGYTGEMIFDGLSMASNFDVETSRETLVGNIGGFTLDGVERWTEEENPEPVRLASFEGGTIAGLTQYSEDYSLKPLAGFIRDIADEVRLIEASDMDDPEALFTQLYLKHFGPVMTWALAQLESSETSVSLNGMRVNLEDEYEPVRFDLGGVELLTALMIGEATDTQELSLSLSDLNLEGPDGIGLSAGDLGMSYTLRDSLVVLGRVLTGFQAGEFTMGDGVRLMLTAYLPDLNLYGKDFGMTMPSPAGDGSIDLSFGSMGLSLTSEGMQTDDAVVNLVFEQTDLDVKVDGNDFDPNLLSFVLGGEEPGLLPKNARLDVKLAEIPMGSILAIADNVTLPPLETMMEPGFDPTTLGLAAIALVSPLLSSPPAVIVEDTDVTGGIVSAMAEGRVEISPLSTPNRSVGSVTIRLSGIQEVNTRAAQLLSDLSAKEDFQSQQAIEQLKGLMGLTMMASGFGIPTDDGALEFVIDIPANEPANVNGLPIPLPF